MSVKDFVPGYATYKALTGDAISPNPANMGLAQVQQAWYSHNVSTVFVWEPFNGVGHASILIGNGSARHGPDRKQYYASWFPGGEGVSKANATQDVKSIACSFQEDCLSEGDGSGGYRIPEHRIEVPSLDANAMHSAWCRIRTNVALYNLLSQNCSDIVARILRAGMSVWQSIGFIYHSYCLYWTPTDVKKFANLLA